MAMGIHSGHRARVKARLRREGANSFHTHELLEAALFYAIPYKDTNPTAHLLLSHAGGLKEVLSVDPRENMAVEGCKEHVAVFLHLLGEVGRRTAVLSNDSPVYETREALAQLAKETVKEETQEATWALFLNNRYSLISKARIHEGYYASAAFRPALVADPALRATASMVVLVSTHINRGAKVDAYEREATESLRRALTTVGVKLLDHFVVSGSILASAMERPTDRATGSYRYHRFCDESATVEEMPYD